MAENCAVFCLGFQITEFCNPEEANKRKDLCAGPTVKEFRNKETGERIGPRVVLCALAGGNVEPLDQLAIIRPAVPYTSRVLSQDELTRMADTPQESTEYPEKDNIVMFPGQPDEEG